MPLRKSATDDPIWEPGPREHEAMKRYFPQFTAHNLEAPAPKARPGTRQTTSIQDQTLEFILSTNWILRPKGLQEFYDELYKQVTAPDVSYDPELGVFRVRCPHDSAARLLEIAHEILDNIVRAEVDNIAGSLKIRHVSGWRLSAAEPEERKAYEDLSCTRELLAMEHRDIWRMPNAAKAEGLTLRQVFGKYDPIVMLQKTTECVVSKGTDGVSLHVSADSKDQVNLARKKLDTLVRYCRLPMRDTKYHHVLYEENKNGCRAELRYIAQLNRKLLTTIFLDHTYFSIGKQGASDYGKIFEKGVIVRMLPYDDQQRVHKVMLLPELTAAISREDSRRTFSVFVDFAYPAKVPVPLEQRELASSSSCGDFHGLNPHRAPNVLPWLQRQPGAEGKNVENKQFKDTEDEQAEETPLQTPARQARLSPSKVLEPLQTSATTSMPTTGGTDQTLAPARDGTVSPSRKTSSNGTNQLLELDDSALVPMNQSVNQSHLDDAPDLLADMNIGTPRPPKFELSTPKVTQFVKLREGDPFESLDTFERERTPALASQIVVGSEQGDLQDTSAMEDLIDFTSPHKSTASSAKRTQETAKESRNESAQDDLIDFGDSPPATPSIPTPRIMEGEQQSRTFHNTMRQQAGSRSIRSKAPSSVTVRSQANIASAAAARRDNGSRMMNRISRGLVKILEPLRIFQGRVTLKADIGRLVFHKVHATHISIPRSVVPVKDKSIEAMEELLNKGHATTSGEPFFTNIVTLSGGDAEYIASMTEGRRSSMKMWNYQGKEVVYEFLFSADTSDGRCTFVIEVNAETFAYTIRRLVTEEGKVFVHCMKRTFDIQLVVDAVQDLEEYFGRFAKELVGSLEVELRSNGLPQLEFEIHKGSAVETKLVRIRHVASYKNNADTCILEVAQKQEMELRYDESDGFIKILATPLAPKHAVRLEKLSSFPVWYEVCIKSTKAEEALAENKTLGFADEATWTADSLRFSGAFEDLVKSATDVVKQMDGVGFWCDNNQGGMVHGQPPGSVLEAEERAIRAGELPAVQYW